ncbi:MAG: arginase [Bacteroidota bacterium]|jgi:arginase
MVIELIKNRSDIGAGTRGSDMGVDAMEIAAINGNDDYFHRHLYRDVETHNETIYQKNTFTFAKRIESVYEQCSRVSDAVSDVILHKRFPIVLSGDHSSALGTISGIKKAFPNKTLGVIWLDAHADIHSPYTSPSGNIHGMPLAAVLGLDNVENKINDIESPTVNFWNRMKSIGTEGPKLLPSHLVYFGLRDYEEEEMKTIQRHCIPFYKVEEVRYRSIENCVQECLEQLEGCDLIYISFDVDSMDCDSISYGTGTPVPTGFLPNEIMGILDELWKSNKVVCLELAEINPLLDNKGNRMAETAFQVLSHISKRIGD